MEIALSMPEEGGRQAWIGYSGVGWEAAAAAVESLR